MNEFVGRIAYRRGDQRPCANCNSGRPASVEITLTPHAEIIDLCRDCAEKLSQELIDIIKKVS